jgi:hypothetical protein
MRPGARQAERLLPGFCFFLGGTMADKRKKIDWEAVEREYRAGQLSIREIGREYGVSAPAITKKAKKERWNRDLSNQVRKAVNAKLVNTEVNKSNASVNEAEVVEAAAERGAEVIRLHRKDINHGRTLVGLLMGQLEEAATNRDEIEDAIEDETAGDSNVKRRNQMLRAVSLPGHAGTIRDLSTAMKNLIALERQAFNLDEKQGPVSDLESVLDEVAQRNASLVKDGE